MPWNPFAPLMFENGAFEKKAQAGSSAAWIWGVLLFLLLFALSLKYKIVNQEAKHPYHLAGLLAVSFVSFYLLAKKIAFRVHFQPMPLLLYALFAYAFLQSLLIGGRGWKDGLYVVTCGLPFFWVSFFVWRTYSEVALVRFLRFVLAAFSCFSFLVAVAAWFGGKLSLGFWTIEQSVSFVARAHGLMGEPTGFGFCAAFCFLFLSYKPKDETKKRDTLVESLFFRFAGVLSFASVLLSGSRISLVLSAVFIVFLGAVKRLRLGTVLLSLLIGAALYGGLLYILSEATNTAPKIYVDNSFRVGSDFQGIQKELRYQRIGDALAFFQTRSLSEDLWGCGFAYVEKLKGSFFVGYIDDFFNYGGFFILCFGGLLFLMLRAAIADRMDRTALPFALLLFGMVAEFSLPCFFSNFFNYPEGAWLMGCGAFAALADRGEGLRAGADASGGRMS